MAIKTNIPIYGNIFFQGETFDDLRSISPTKIRDGYSAIVRGQTATADGLGGLYAWEPTSTAPDDGETVLAPTAGGQGRWIKIAVGQTGPRGPQGAPSTVPGPKGDQGGKGETGSYVASKPIGVVGDNISDDSAAIAAATVTPVALPAGAYRIASPINPMIENLDVQPGAVLNAPYLSDVLTSDASGATIGLMHNFLEHPVADTVSAVTTGILRSPPLSQANITSDIVHLAHWYNDSGLEATRAANGSNGWLGWYLWAWNYANQTIAGLEPQDPSRLSLMGYFRGDDPKVLDWQCYWNLEYGINAVDLNPSADVDDAVWQTPSDQHHWLYQLFTNTPNFKRLSYVLWGKSDVNTPASKPLIEAAWHRLVDRFYLNPDYGNHLCVTDARGARFPVIYIFEGEFLRGVFDDYNGSSNTRSFLISIASVFRAHGYGGVCLMARHGTSDTLMSRTDLEANGVLYVDADYAGITGETGNEPDYASKIPSISAPTTRSVMNIALGRTTKKPHPSNYSLPGITPALYASALRRARDEARKPHMVKVVGIYSIWEWAEGGVNLSPTRGDGFAYLEATRAAHRDSAAIPSLKTGITVTIENGGSMPTGGDVVDMISGSPVYVSYIKPILEPGYDGQIIRLRNIGPYSITIPSEQDAAGIGVRFATRPAQFPSGSVNVSEMELVFDAAANIWRESWRSASMQTVVATGEPWSAVNVTEDRIFDATADDLAGTKMALGTLINDLRRSGLIS